MSRLGAWQSRPDRANPAKAGTATASRTHVEPTKCANVKLGFALFRHTRRCWCGLINAHCTGGLTPQGSPVLLWNLQFDGEQLLLAVDRE